MSMFSKVLRAGEGKKVRRLAELVPLVNALEPEMEARSDEELQAMTVAFRQRLDNEVDGDQRDLSRGLRPDGLAVAGHHHLAALTIGDPRIALLREVDLGPVESGTVLADVAHLLLGQGSNLVGHDLPAMRDDYVHSVASSASVIDSYCTGWPVLLIGR